MYFTILLLGNTKNVCSSLQCNSKIFSRKKWLLDKLRRNWGNFIIFICICCNDLEGKCGTSTRNSVEKSSGLFGVLFELCVKEAIFKICKVIYRNTCIAVVIPNPWSIDLSYENLQPMRLSNNIIWT